MTYKISESKTDAKLLRVVVTGLRSPIDARDRKSLSILVEEVANRLDNGFYCHRSAVITNSVNGVNGLFQTGPGQRILTDAERQHAESGILPRGPRPVDLQQVGRATRAGNRLAVFCFGMSFGVNVGVALAAVCVYLGRVWS